MAAATGHPVRVRRRLPVETDETPPADAVLVAPATFNTINKWSAGINDSAALGVLNETLGAGLLAVAAPHCKSALATHPAYETSLTALRRTAALVLECDQSIATLGACSAWGGVIAGLRRARGHGPVPQGRRG